MLYERQKELLYIESQLKDLDKIKLQKLEFMACIESEEPSYEFIPYQHGPYSITLQNDLDYLCREELLQCSEDEYKTKGATVPPLPPKRKAELDRALSAFGSLGSQELLKLIYIKYPQYAVNSVDVEDLLSAAELGKVKKQVPQFDSPALFTIGYQHKSLEKYLLQLFENGIKLLVDVRANSNSMKKEFIGTHLEKACQLLGIDYVHYPQLGIPKNYRNDLPDRKELFQVYKTDLLPQKTKEIDELVALFHSKDRLALTCFEADYNDCHRHFLSEVLLKQLGGKIALQNI